MERKMAATNKDKDNRNIIVNSDDEHIHKPFSDDDFKQEITQFLAPLCLLP